MLNWILDTPRNTITNFFPDVSKLKLITLWTINFPYQYLGEAKAYLESNRDTQYLCRSLFFIKLQISLSRNFTKVKEIQHVCFLMNFARYLRHFFTEYLQATAFVLRKNIVPIKM